MRKGRILLSAARPGPSTMGAPCTAFLLRLVPLALLAVLPTTTITTSALDNIPQETVRKVHIVYLGERLQDEDQATASHRSLLEQATRSYRDEKENGLVYTYKRSFNGFAAYLTDEEARHLSGMEGIISVFPSRRYELQTTRSWDFMGFRRNVKRVKSIESNVVIGLVDTGITPESESFDDDGGDHLGPPPKKWKGKCETTSDFSCNNKIIGARAYGCSGPRDEIGHGTHTASTAAGREVVGVSLYGLAKGTARGAVPSARIAIYRVCGTDFYDEDLLAAMDDAIADGVDIISLTLKPSSYPGGGSYMENSLDIGSFHAVRKGVLVVAAAGNSGPQLGSVFNFMPWTLTVAGSTIDRSIVTKIVLGNGETITGSAAINTFASSREPLPLVFAGDVSRNKSFVGGFCDAGDLISAPLVRGKIVLCDDGPLSQEYGLPGGIAGAIIYDDTHTSYPFPASTVDNQEDYQALLGYINENRNATAKILKSEMLHDSKAPMVAKFSSRGPNPVMLDILKPDITAPAVGIIAASSPMATQSLFPADKRHVRYNIFSGTSMACPHVAGAAAYVKSFHPDWSPAAIKSALMTTAYSMDAASSPHMELGYGSGHVNPVGALNPGLVYEAYERDYVEALCHLGYNQTRLRLITGDASSCGRLLPRGGVADVPADGIVWGLNYPSVSLSVKKLPLPLRATFPRTVTNVGAPNSTYRVTVHYPHADNHTIDVTVKPSVLLFTELGQKRRFVVTVSASDVVAEGRLISASMVWSDGSHRVVSPIVLHNITLPAH